MKIIIYTQNSCLYCQFAKDEFRKRDWVYTEYNLSDDENKVSLFERLPNAKTVPQIWIDDKHIGGYDELMIHLTN
tara:strand:- start:291 stop:515 length:225 start_codon:yes stop_codon:yes gene_type:complete